MASAPALMIRTKLLYGFGSVAYGVKDLVFRAYLLIYYNQVIGLPAGLVSAAILAALVVDSVFDPIIGQWSDNLRSRWGRRHPFMYAAALPAAGAFLLLWTPPAGASQPALFAYVFAVAVAVRTFITMYEIPSSALAPELSADYNERTSILSYRYFFGYLGGLGLAFAALRVFLRPTPEHPVGQLNPDGYWSLALTSAGLMLLSILVSAAGTHDRIRYLRVPPARAPKSVGESFREMLGTFGHRGFQAVMAFGVMKYTALGLAGAMSLYFGTYLWHLNSGQLAILTLDGVIAAGISLWLAPRLSRTRGKRNAALALVTATLVFALAPYMLRITGLFWPNGSPWLLPTLFGIQLLQGICNVTGAVLTASMIADVVEDSELRTGRRSEGLFFAASSLMQKCVSGFGVFAGGMLLTLVQFPERARPADVPVEVVEQLVLTYMPLLAFFYLGGACFLLFYRIDQRSHEENLRRLRDSAALVGSEPSGGPTYGAALRHDPGATPATVK